jgi:hypothetical protein
MLKFKYHKNEYNNTLSLDIKFSSTVHKNIAALNLNTFDLFNFYFLFILKKILPIKVWLYFYVHIKFVKQNFELKLLEL